MALTRIRQMLDESEAPPGTVVRLALDQSDDLRLQADRPRTTDEVFAIEDRDVLVVDDELRKRLRGRRLTVEGDSKEVTLR
jgi:hypothetical protein